MTVAAAVLATLVLAALAILQLLVAAGRPLGRYVWGGQHEVLPRGLRIGSAISVLLYAGMAWVLLGRAGALPIHAGFAAVATWVLLAYFAIGILLNAVSRSPRERWTMAPACLVLAACTLVVAVAGERVAG